MIYNAHDFNSMDDLIARIIEVDQDDEKYLRMIRTPAFTVEHMEHYSDDVL